LQQRYDNGNGIFDNGNGRYDNGNGRYNNGNGRGRFFFFNDFNGFNDGDVSTSIVCVG
jgi:hypothetical protein